VLKKMPIELPKSPFFYPILDTEFTADITGDARRLIQAGVRILQLRAKNQTKRQIFDLTIQLAELCNRGRVCLILNDCVDITLVTGVSGVHLGQDDFPVQEARTLLRDRLIGCSTHTLEQFQVAQKSPVDYIAIGPVYKTTTKQSSNQMLGIATVDSWLRNKSKPVVAIGGIQLEHFGELLNAGIDGIAMISALYSTGNVYEMAVRCMDEIRKYEKV
jgi:thiamine-phosphate pyrophosphorylase